MKFKAGDKIKLILNVGLAAQIGATAIVRNPAYKFSLICQMELLEIDWIRNELWNNQNDGGYTDNIFELAESLPQPKERPSLADIWGRERWGI